jgi:hypothetical protein
VLTACRWLGALAAIPPEHIQEMQRPELLFLGALDFSLRPGGLEKSRFIKIVECARYCDAAFSANEILIRGYQ